MIAVTTLDIRPGGRHVSTSDTQVGDAHLAACALHLLLAQHGELAAFEFEWRIDHLGVIRPGLPVDHPDIVEATQALGRALELPMRSEEYTSKSDGVHRFCVTVIGRWGGAEWKCSNYGTVQGPALRAVTS